MKLDPVSRALIVKDVARAIATIVENAIAKSARAERERLADILRAVASKEEGWGTSPTELLCQVADQLDLAEEADAPAPAEAPARREAVVELRPELPATCHTCGRQNCDVIGHGYKEVADRMGVPLVGEDGQAPLKGDT